MLSCLFSLLLIGCCFGFVGAQTDDNKFAVKDCRGRASGICLKGECVCEEWQIQLFKKDGKEWGLITSKTLDSVKRQLKKSQDFDVSYARFFNQSVDDSAMNYQRPGKPICKTKCPTGAARSSWSKAELQRRDEITETADGLLDKMIKETARITLRLAVSQGLSFISLLKR